MMARSSSSLPSLLLARGRGGGTDGPGKIGSSDSASTSEKGSRYEESAEQRESKVRSASGEPAWRICLTIARASYQAMRASTVSTVRWTVEAPLATLQSMVAEPK